MLLAKIQSSVNGYKNWLLSLKTHPFAHKWESVQHFQTNWDAEAADPVEMFDRCFQNSETRRLWQTANWYPKRMMAEFWKFDPMTVRLMFNDLFNETKEVDGRISRFLFGCDTLLHDYKRANITSVENNHYHGDFQMIALYLAFRYPESYAPYDFPVFQTTLTKFGSRDIPQQNDLARYFKVLRTLMTFILKDPAIEPAMQRLLYSNRYYKGKTLLLAEDFCRFASETPLVKGDLG
mgnify:FL=1